MTGKPNGSEMDELADKIFKGVLASLHFASKVLDSEIFNEKKVDVKSGQSVESVTADLSGGKDRDAILKALQQSAAETNLRIEAMIHRAVRDLKAEIGQSTAIIIDKIEREKHEVLFSRINSVGTALRIGMTSECLPMVLELNELTDYACLRMNEGKLHWVTAAVIGKSTYIAAMERLPAGSNLPLRQELSAICDQAKSQILDILAPQILAKGGRISWDKIRTFMASSTDASITLDFRRDVVDVAAFVTDPAGTIGTGKNQEIRPKGNFAMGRIVRWRKSLGDFVSPGDILVGINIDGRLENIYADVQGTLSRIVIANGGTFSSQQQPTLLGLVSG